MRTGSNHDRWSPQDTAPHEFDDTPAGSVMPAVCGGSAPRADARWKIDPSASTSDPHWHFDRDPANLGDLDRLFAQIKREKDKLDIVFANAGVAKFAALGEITEEHYDSLFDIHVKGLLFTVQKALPLLPDGASIILNASMGAGKGPPAASVACATKAAVRSFARTWTTDLKDRRIRVNAVSPGLIDTPAVDNLASTAAGQQLFKMISDSVPLGRRGTADEIAKAAVFLASDDSSYITGAELFVDGGFAQV